MTKKLSVPFNLDLELLKSFRAFKDNINEVYMPFPTDIIKSARILEWDEKKDAILEEVIPAIRDMDINVSILINSFSDINISNNDYIELLLMKLQELYLFGANRVILANPILMKKINEVFGDDIEVCSSIISSIDDIHQIEHLVNKFGLKEYCLPTYKMRDKNFINDVKSLGVRVKMMVNYFCNPHCPCYIHHHQAVSSFNRDMDRLYFEELCIQKDINPFKKNFLLPKELDMFDHVDLFKLSGREDSTDIINKRIMAYSSGIIANNNLLDLMDGGKMNMTLHPYDKAIITRGNIITNCNYNCNTCNYCDEFLDKYYVWTKEE